MDILFNRKRIYTVHLPFEDVQENIQSIMARKWHDFSRNISCRMTDSGNYTFTYKWSIGFGSIGMPAYLKVKLIKENNKTKIETRLRPGFEFVIAFYLIIALFLFELNGGSLLEGPKIFIFTFLLVFDLILFGLIILFTNGLKNKFEKIMRLQ